jgi:hypothetical protein
MASERLVLCARAVIRPPLPAGAATDPAVSREFSAADAAKLCADGFATRIDASTERARPTRACLTAFTVVEQNAEGVARRRAIHWPRDANESLKGVYECNVPLQHISAYLQDVHEECGATLDLKSAFWQVEIPREHRCFYRFRDADGILYEMTVLIMGGSCSVEITQLLTSVVAGHPDVVRREFAAPARTKVWVDGVCYVGSRRDVARSLQMARKAAADLGATWKDPCFEPKTEYVFIGVTWDHVNHRVRVGPKTLSKLTNIRSCFWTAREFEQLIGRVSFASDVTQTPRAEFYFLLKWAKRLCNALNVGDKHPDDLVMLPLSLHNPLREWIRQSTRWHQPRVAPAGARPVLFTDATLVGYGAILVLPSGQTHVTGSRFPPNAREEIGTCEALAVLYALEDFAKILRDYPSGIDLRLDNTSVEAGLQRGSPRAAHIAQVVADILRTSLRWNVPLFPSRVGTKENPADETSRGKQLDIEKLRRALARRSQNTRMGAGRTYGVEG